MEKICVLMSTYNGEKYIREQIDSILNQKNVDIDLIVRDDGSTDSTVEILNEYAEKGLLKFFTGENLKPAKSFMNLVYNAGSYKYYAFADQDDFWNENKLYKAVEKISSLTKAKKKVVYISSVEIVDKNLNHISDSISKVKFSLEESFIISPAVGCTMVFNNYMRDEIIKKNIDNLEIGLHDSWIYRVALAIGGEIIYDTNSYIKYRQHENNAIGAKNNKSLEDSIKELLKVRRKYKSEVAINILNLYNDEILEKNKIFLEKIARLNKKTTIFYKVKIILDRKIKSTNKKMNFKFYYDILKNRI